MTKVTRHKAQLFLRDLTQFAGVTFAHPDRLTRAEVDHVRRWAETQPAVMRALRNRSDPEFNSVRLFKEVVDYFAEQHPIDAAGHPAPWPGGRLIDDDTPISNMTADEAAARLAWASTRHEYRAAYLDKSSPDHAALVRQTLGSPRESKPGRAIRTANDRKPRPAIRRGAGPHPRSP